VAVIFYSSLVGGTHDRNPGEKAAIPEPGIVASVPKPWFSVPRPRLVTQRGGTLIWLRRPADRRLTRQAYYMIGAKF
jgi:hypothetical protein